jgi:homoserine O-acetyltransferase
MIVNKHIFELDRLELLSRATLKQIRVGYETYGRLSPAKDNAILICHYFSGTSHAAGRYTEIEKLPGYWDAVIGPNKPFDTDPPRVLGCCHRPQQAFRYRSVFHYQL